MTASLRAGLLLLTLASPLAAQSSRFDTFLPGTSPDLQFRFHLPADLGNDQVTIASVRAGSPYFYRKCDPWRFAAGFSYKLTRIDTGHADVRSLTGHNIDLPLDLFWSPGGIEATGWSAWFRVSPGLSSDLKSVGWDDVSGTIVATGGYRFSREFALLFGAYFSRDIGRPVILPALGFIWKPADAWSIALLPPRFVVSWKPADKWSLKWVTEPEGGSWHARDGGDDRTYELRLFNSRAEVQREIGSHAALYVGAGLSFGGRLRVLDDAGDRHFSENIRPAPLINAGLKIAF